MDEDDDLTFYFSFDPIILILGRKEASILVNWLIEIKPDGDEDDGGDTSPSVSLNGEGDGVFITDCLIKIIRKKHTADILRET